MVDQLSERDLRAHRNNLMDCVQRHRKNKKISMTPVEGTSISIQFLFSRKKIKRDRSKLFKDYKRIIQEHDADIKNAEKHRKRYQHLEKSRIKSVYSIPKDKMSLMSLTEKTVKECLPR